MNRIFALACLLLLFVVALPLCAQPEVAPPSPPKPAPPPATPRKLVVKRLNLNNISTAECLKLLQTPKIQEQAHNRAGRMPALPRDGRTFPA